MLRVKALAATALIFSVAMAAPARADAYDETAFLKNVQAKIPVVLARYGPEAVIEEGYRVCVYDRRDMDFSDEIDRIIFEMPMSRKDAIEFSVLSPIYLDCAP